jgi:hypothetical protein
LVNTEPVKSADPPIVVGISAFTTSSVISEALRVAMAGFSAANFAFKPAIAGASEGGMSPESAASKDLRRGFFARRASQSLRSSLPRRPASRQVSRRS